MNDTFYFGPFCLAVSTRLLTDRGVPVPIGGRALDLLIAMIEKAGEIVGPQELRDFVWPSITVADAGLRVQMSALKRTLRDGKDGARYILNIPGRGYTFVGLVVNEEEEMQSGPLIPNFPISTLASSEGMRRRI